MQACMKRIKDEKDETERLKIEEKIKEKQNNKLKIQKISHQ